MTEISVVAGKSVPHSASSSKEKCCSSAASESIMLIEGSLSGSCAGKSLPMYAVEYRSALQSSSEKIDGPHGRTAIEH